MTDPTEVSGQEWPAINVPCLTVYYEAEFNRRDGKPCCVDEDFIQKPDQVTTGDSGERFATAESAGAAVIRWLREQSEEADEADSEQQRRDEKRGLYAEHADPAN